jgi:hypothetical protein
VQDVLAAAPNEDGAVGFLTMSFNGAASAAQRAAAEEAVRAVGSVTWKTSARAGRTYGLIALREGGQTLGLRAMPGATVHDTAIIALAVFPSAPEALPCLLEALGGQGRPAGVLSCVPIAGGVVVEWDPRLGSPRAIWGTVDVELARYGGGRTAELLTPLPEATIDALAAEGLQTSEIGAEERVLETLLERAGLADAG